MAANPPSPSDDSIRREARAFAWALGALVIVYAPVLFRLARYSLSNEFNSYLGLVPLISVGLVWLQERLPREAAPPARKLGASFGACGLGTLVCAWLLGRPGAVWADDRLSLAVLSLVFFVIGAAGWSFGRTRFRAIGFPLAFLVCMVPLPLTLVGGLERFLQYSSADTADLFFDWSDVPYLRQGDLDFHLPNITLQVAPECSGIQSSLALFVVSLAAGYLFLRAPWKRALFTLMVVPLGILRNGVRIVTIGELCTHFGPQMIHSYLHRKGGWIFFLVSLGPLLALLWLLARSDQPPAKSTRPIEGSP